MNKRLVIALVTIALAIVILVIWLKPDHALSVDASTATTPQANPSSEPSSTAQAPAVIPEAQVQQHLKLAVERRRFARLDPDKLEQGIRQTQMFQIADARAVAASNPIKLSDAQMRDGRAFISYDPYTLEGKMVGDRIQFKVPQLGISRSAVVDRVKVDSQDDIVSWSGHLENGDQNNESFYISQTIKDNYTVGTIITRDGGMYSIETKNGAGWVTNGKEDLGNDVILPQSSSVTKP